MATAGSPGQHASRAPSLCASPPPFQYKGTSRHNCVLDRTVDRTSDGKAGDYTSSDSLADQFESSFNVHSCFAAYQSPSWTLEATWHPSQPLSQLSARALCDSDSDDTGRVSYDHDAAKEIVAIRLENQLICTLQNSC